jgi:dCTP diphosphatase
MELEDLIKSILAFRDARDWAQFHRPNQLAAALSIEAAEVQEHFLWKTPEQVARIGDDAEKLSAVGDEIADVLIYALLLAHELKLEPAAIIQGKLAKNAAKYPVHKSHGTAAKYTELQ